MWTIHKGEHAAAIDLKAVPVVIGAEIMLTVHPTFFSPLPFPVLPVPWFPSLPAGGLAEGRATVSGAAQHRPGARGARQRPGRRVRGAWASADRHDAQALCPGAGIPSEGRQRAAGRPSHGHWKPDEDSNGEVGSGLNRWRL
jgi:hypothetical protein